VQNNEAAFRNLRSAVFLGRHHGACVQAAQPPRQAMMAMSRQLPPRPHRSRPSLPPPRAFRAPCGAARPSPRWASGSAVSRRWTTTRPWELA